MRTKRIILSLLVFTLYICCPPGTEAESTGSMRIGVQVSDSFTASEGVNVQFRTYTQDYDENVIDSADISLDYGEGVPIGIAVSSVDEQNTGFVLLDGVFINDGFDEQLHIEMNDDGTFSMEVCDSLADVPSGFDHEEQVMENILDSGQLGSDEGMTIAVDISF